MNWEEYKKEAIKYRMEYMNTEEYVAILLMGIIEELNEYRSSVYACEVPEDQLNEYGDLLWNVAELENILDERSPRHRILGQSGGSHTFDLSLSCIQAVRKHYMRDRNREKLIKCASDILQSCHIHFVSSGIAKDAMIANCAKMKERFA